MTPGTLALLLLCAGSVSFLVSLIATSGMIRLAPRLGLVDKPGHRKIHHVPKPLGGGVGIVAGVGLPLVAAVIILALMGAVGGAEDAGGVGLGGGASNGTTAEDGAGDVAAGGAVGDHPIDPALLRGAREQIPLAIGFLAGGLGLFLLGLADDRRPLGPFVKLSVQLAVVAAFVLIFDVRLLTVLDGLGLGPVPSVVITVLWIAGVANAFNFLDNMDGLSAGVAAICAAVFLVAALLVGQYFVAVTLTLLLGALLGFLVLNFPPARIFMGDSGALFIGFVLGVLTVRTTYLRPDQDLAAGWYAVFAPLIVLAVPLYDMIVVSAIRISRGKSPFVGDTNHFSHRLVARGMSRRTAVLCIYLVTATTGVAAILLPMARTTFAAILIFIQTLLILGVVMLLEMGGRGERDEGAGPA